MEEEKESLSLYSDSVKPLVVDVMKDQVYVPEFRGNKELPHPMEIRFKLPTLGDMIRSRSNDGDAGDKVDLFRKQLVSIKNPIYLRDEHGVETPINKEDIFNYPQLIELGLELLNAFNRMGSLSELEKKK
jgi:hypothetical protein